MDTAAVTGRLTVIDSGFTLPNPAIVVWDYGFSQLFEIKLTGGNVETIAGHVAYPRVIKQQTASIPIFIDTTVDVLGDPTAGPVSGLRGNLEALHDELIIPATIGDGTLDIELETELGGDVLAGRMQFVDIQVGQRYRAGWKAVIDVVLPDGPLEAAP